MRDLWPSAHNAKILCKNLIQISSPRAFLTLHSAREFRLKLDLTLTQVLKHN